MSLAKGFRLSEEQSCLLVVQGKEADQERKRKKRAESAIKIGLRWGKGENGELTLHLRGGPLPEKIGATKKGPERPPLSFFGAGAGEHPH